MICFQPAAAACRSCLTRVRSPQIVHSPARPGMRIAFPGATWLSACTMSHAVARCGTGKVGRQHEKRPSGLVCHARSARSALLQARDGMMP